jgi:hypothetical protein
MKPYYYLALVIPLSAVAVPVSLFATESLGFESPKQLIHLPWMLVLLCMEKLICLRDRIPHRLKPMNTWYRDDRFFEGPNGERLFS